jgi:hypothetical protein
VAATGALLVASIMAHRQHGRETVRQSVSGELVAYEVADKTLTVRTEDGVQFFVVVDGASLHEGARTITLVDLASAGGCPTKVWFEDAAGRLVASDVRISCPAFGHEAATSFR